MWGSDEPGDLQLLQTERQTEEQTGEALSRAAEEQCMRGCVGLTSSGVRTPVSLNLDSCH